MNQEKMKILEMLEQGRISADEAAKLLSGVDSAAAPPQSNNGAAPPPPRAAEGRTESMTDEIGRKFSAFMKSAEPKVRRFAEVAVEKTANAADALSKGLSSSRPAPAPTETRTHAQPATHARPTPPAKTGSGIEEKLEILVTQRGAELNLGGLNGQVMVKGYNGDKISAKLFTVAKRAGAKAHLAVLGNKYYLHFDENDFERVCIDAFVPEGYFDNVKISTINGDIDLSSLAASNFKIENLNGKTTLRGINADNIVAECNNGLLSMNDIKAAFASIENFNAAIAVNNIDIEKLKLATFNAGINMQIHSFNSFDNYIWNIETSNDKLELILPSYNTLGYHIKAHAALDVVKLGLIGMSFIKNDRSNIEAKSISFDEALKKVELNLETSNAPLVVN